MLMRNFCVVAVGAALAWCAAGASGQQLGELLPLPLDESAVEAVTILSSHKTPEGVLAADFPLYAVVRVACGKPGTLRLEFEYRQLGKLDHQRTLFVDVVPDDRSPEEKKTGEKKSGDPPAADRTPQVDPASPGRVQVRTLEPFQVQWLTQNVDFPGEWKPRKVKFRPAQDAAPPPVTSREQAIARIQAFERKLYRRMYGKGAALPPLASAGQPHSVDESEETFRIEYRQPFGERGGGYIKAFSVSKQTGEVSRVAWMLGR